MACTLLHFGVPSDGEVCFRGLTLPPRRRKFSTSFILRASKSSDEEPLLVVVGAGAAGMYGAIRAKTVAPDLGVLVVEKGNPLSKVKISGGGRCNLTNGHCPDNMALAEKYPRGNKELKGSFFNIHNPMDTMAWFSEHGVPLKIEDDGRVFPVSDDSSSILNCLLSEAKHRGVDLQSGKAVINSSVGLDGKFYLRIERRGGNCVEYAKADYLLVASGSSKQGHSLAIQLGHSIVDPVPSLFTFKINNPRLAEFSGVSFPKVKAKLIPESSRRNIPQLTQVGPMLITHWGVSGPVILRLSAWGALQLHESNYRGTLLVDFVPDLNEGEARSILAQHKLRFKKQKVANSCPSTFCLTKRFWKYLLDLEGSSGDNLWASVSNSSSNSIAHLLKHFTVEITGKGQYKEEFVAAGGVPLSEISLNTMESKVCRNLFFAGEVAVHSDILISDPNFLFRMEWDPILVLNVDGVTGGFNFQNAWSGGYIAGTTVGERAASRPNISDAVRN